MDNPAMPHFMRSLSEFFLETVETVVIALSIFLVVYLFFMQPHQVNGQSMVPNFQSGEYVLTDKVSYKLRNPQRGEVVVFHAPESANCPKGTGCDFIKRVIAVPGETISLVNSRYVINGQPISESYIPDDFQTLPGAFIRNRTITLGPDEYFVSGDNRPFSSDSRAWGPINKSNIVGRAFFRYWPIPVIGVIRTALY
jgi:signal peptidase I